MDSYWCSIENFWSPRPSAQFNALLKNPEFLGVFLATLDRASQKPYYEIKAHNKYLQLEFGLQIHTHVLLDIAIYNRRIYLAADSGLYHLDTDMGNNEIEMLSPLIKRHDARSMSTLAGYGSVNVSCGDEGLFSGFDEFGRTGLEKPQPLRRVAEKSQRTSWANHDLINYANGTNPVLLKGIGEKTDSRGFEAERTVLTDFNPITLDLGYLLNDVSFPDLKNSGSVKAVYNSDNRLFIHTSSGQFIIVGLRKREGEPVVTFRRVYQTEETNLRILSMHPASFGLVLETDDRILIFTNGKFYPILDSEVLSVRTFNQSKRYRNIVLTTTEEGILITAVFQENHDLKED
ncbi:MAG: hypothetical protein WCF84_17155 [Anaerolineae bacterium]